MKKDKANRKKDNGKIVQFAPDTKDKATALKGDKGDMTEKEIDFDRDNAEERQEERGSNDRSDRIL